MYVAPDGTVYTDSDWDESGREAGVYKDGNAVANPGRTHGWGNFGGRAVTANSAYLYIGTRMDSQGGGLVDPNTWPPKGTYWYGISRRPVSNVSSGAPFPGGKGGSGDTVPGSFLIVNQVPEGTDATIAGLTADNSRLYVSNPYANEVRIFDANTMASVGSFSIARPGKLVIDRAGTLWIIQTGTGSTPPKVLHYSTAGAQLAQQITTVVNPQALAIDNQGRLMVAECGPSQQILTFDISSTPALVSSFGVAGGISSGTPGAIGDLKLSSPIGVGSDSAGNIYVGSSIAGTDLRKFTPAGQMVWRVLGLEFIDTAAADAATDGADVYTENQHFTIDYTKSNGQEWTWKGMSIDAYKYPNDPRLNAAIAQQCPSVLSVRNIQGRKYLILTDQYSTYLHIYRMNGEIAVPSGFFSTGHINNFMPGVQPATGRWIWRDLNGDGNFQANEFLDADGATTAGTWGWEMDEQGNVWQTSENSDGVRKYTLQGIDAAGNLMYSRAASTSFGIPAPFTQIERVKYTAQTDTLYLSGYTSQNPIGSGYWGQAGTEIVRYDNWSSGNRTPRWRIVLPYNPSTSSTIKAISVAGQRVFAGLLASGPTQNVYVYDAATGASVGQLVPGPEVQSNMGWIDGSHNLQAYQRANGEYLVFEEEVAWEKVLMYRFAGTPTAGVVVSPSSSSLSGSQTQQFTATVSGTTNTAVTWSISPQVGGISSTGLYTAPATISTPQTITVTATSVADLTKSSSATITLVAAAGGGGTTLPIRVNAGGSAYTDSLGRFWSADTGFAGGNSYVVSSAISNTTTPALYQSERWNDAPFQYQYAVPNGTYQVNLKFAEIYYTQAGQRVFNVALNGQQVLTSFDPLAAAGAPNTAVDKSFPVSVTGGQITILFSPVVSTPKISAIEIVANTGVVVSPATATVNGGKTQQFAATVTGNSNAAVTWSLSPQAGTISAGGLYTAPASTSATQTIKVTATSVGDPTKSATAVVTVPPAATTAFRPIRVNAGGPAYTDPSGNSWAADMGYIGGNTYVVGSTITGCMSPVVHQSERWSSTTLQYQFSAPNGPYLVNLMFAEIYYTQPGQRIFNVVINGQTVLWNFDPLAEAGGPNKAVDRKFAINVTGGLITIQLVPVVSNPKVSAIEIVAGGALVRVNAGGPAYKDPSGNTWSADSGYSGGYSYVVNSSISRTSTPTLYQSEHWNSGTLQYQFSVPNGARTVTLKFAEIYYTQAGQRVFNVLINGTQVLTNFDPFAAAGGPNIAVDKQFTANVTTGVVTIQLVPVISSPKISAIEILN
jgi:hypothetical protein